MRKILLIIAVLSSFPLLLFVFHPLHPHTSDGLMHLARIAAYYKEVAGGQFPVRWASDLNYGYGTPIFNFFHPLPYLITTMFVALGSSLSFAFRISFLIGHIAAGIFMFLFIYEVTRNKKTAIFVSLFYQFAPFRLVDIVVRGSLGGIYSYALLPLLMFGIAAYVRGRNNRFLFLISITSSLMALSHNITGFMFFGAATVVALFLSQSWKERLLVVGSMLWGVVHSAWFVFPALLEHKYTYGFEFTKNLFYKHFPPILSLILPNFTNAPSLRVGEVPVQIGIFHLAAAAASLWAVMNKKVAPSIRSLLGASLLVSFVAILLMQTITTPLWEAISVLRQFQYPWRILSVITFTTSVGAIGLAVLLKKAPQSVYLLLLAGIIAGSVVFWKSPEGYDQIDEKYWWNYPLTTNYYGEVDTIWSDGPAKMYAKSALELIEGDIEIQPVSARGVRYRYVVTSPRGGAVRQNTQYFPGWSAFVDGVKTPIEFQSQHNRGLITFKLPPGRHDVVVAFVQSRTQRISNLISLVSIGLTMAMYFFLKKRSSI